MIKSRCQNRMRADREKLINAVRNINVDEGKSFVENTIRMFVKVLKFKELQTELKTHGTKIDGAQFFMQLHKEDND